MAKTSILSHVIITETTKPHAARVHNLCARVRKTDPGLDSPVRATEEMKKGNVMFIVGRTQVNCKRYSFTKSIEWAEFMNCYISLIGTLSRQPKTMAQAWMRSNCN